MAREEKRIELRMVDDTTPSKVPVIRLESEETLRLEKPIRLAPPVEESMVSKRLALPNREEVDLRTYEPGIEALIEGDAVDPNLLEQDWGKQSRHHAGIPWGWFALIAMLLMGAVIWSLTRVRTADTQAAKIRTTTESVLGKDALEDRQAAELIDRIEKAITGFFAATTIDSRASFVRHSERVKPLMETHYAGGSIPADTMTRIRLLQPLTLDNRANFWIASVVMTDNSTRSLIVEIIENGQARIDWETFVCHQPMVWDTFAVERPTGVSLDFRVYVEPDNFFSHEFADAKRWDCFRLTALNSDETLFGYIRTDDPLAKHLRDLLQQNNVRVSMILRMTIPEGIQSRRGVVLEKLLSPRWLYIDPPADAR